MSAERMVREYVRRLYMPAADASRAVSADHFARGRALAGWVARVRAGFGDVRVLHVEAGGAPDIPIVGDAPHVRAFVALGELQPEDVRVEAVAGRMTEDGDLVDTWSHELRPVRVDGDAHVFEAQVELTRAGTFGYTVRVVPHHELLAFDAELGLVANAA